MDPKMTEVAKIVRMLAGDDMEEHAKQIFGKDGQLDPFIQRAALLALASVLKSKDAPISRNDVAMILFFLVYDIAEMDETMTGTRMKDLLTAKQGELGKIMLNVDGYLAWDALTAIEKQSANKATNPFT